MIRLARASKLKPSIKLLLCVILNFLITNIDAGPSRAIGISKCVSFCKEFSKFEYDGQTTNIYEYNTQITTSIIGGSTQESNLYLAAQVEISSPSPCELQLQMTNVKIDESKEEHLIFPIPGSENLIKQLELLPLKFSFQDGKIEHICASEEDPIWVLNIKRGILSTLQNTMANISQEQTTHDVDVSGRCLTKYQLSANSQGENHFLQRHKDLKGCSQHHSHLSSFQSVPYTSNSQTQTIPLLSGSQVCSQTIIRKRVNNVECREVHIFQPFQNGETGAQTTVTQKLTFVSGKRSLLNFSTFRIRKTSLVLETQGQSEARDTDITTILSYLETLERESFPKVQSSVPEHFIDLVRELRLIKYDALKTVLARAPGQTGRQHLLDALPLVGTAPSMTLMRELFVDGKLSESQIDVWLGSLNFIKNVNIDMISAVRPLLDGEPQNKVILSLSSLVHAYCKGNGDCTGENPVIEDILQQLVSFIGTNCRMNSGDTTGLVVALKAIGNAGRLPSNDDQQSFNTLKKCLENKSNPTEVRLAALDAYRRFSCGSYKHDPIVTLFTNIREDTEVRIHAYLTSMKCPDRQLVKTIEGVLHIEDVNQVGSFVWTHLTNLQETSSPDKQAIKELVSNNFLQNKFSTDVRKYSRNYEGTMYWEKENVGVGIDSNVIFVPDSFIPRSAMLNLTCHLFGESVNLVEVGARVHSMEQLLEPLFGPEGYFPDQTINEALHTMRVKRDVFNSAIRRLDTVYSQASYGNDRLPGGSIYTRIFGNELTYKSFEISHKTATPTLIDETGKNWFDISHLFDNLRTGKSTEFTKSTVLLDASYTVSTSVGIPLSLTVQSAATVGLSVKGELDLANFWDKSELEIQGTLRPSAAVQVHGTLSVQLGKVDSKIKSGLKLKNTMHTSTASQARLMMKGSKIVHLSLTLPEDKQEIFEIQSDLLVVHSSPQIKVNTKNKNQQRICTPEVLSRALGIQLCGETNLPEKLSFPLYSPASVSLYLEKTDVFKSYELEYKWEEDEGKADIAFVFSTPGSKVNRRLAADFHYDKNVGILETMLQTPKNDFRANGKYTLSEQGLNIMLKSGQQQVLNVIAGVQHSGSRIEPNILLEFYSKPIVEVGGVIDVMNIAEPGGKANLEITLKHLMQTPIQLNGDLVHNGEAFDSNMAINSYLLSGNSRSQFRIKPNMLSSKAELNYSWRQAEMKTINVSAKVQITKKGSKAKYLATTSLAVSDLPDSHVEIEWETQAKEGLCENTLKFILGKSKWEGKALFNRNGTLEHHDIHFQVALVAPRHEIDYNLEFAHQFYAKGISTKFNARKDSKHELNSQLQYLTETDPLLKKIFITEVSWPTHKYSVKAFVTEIRSGVFESEITIIPNREDDIKGTLIYKNVATNLALEQLIEFRLRGLMTSAVSGFVSMSASEKLRHIGAKFEIEGNEEYSGRWSTSLDHSLVRRNIQKIEGKLNINEKKYNAELSLRQTKNGDRTVTVDLQLTKRIRLEGHIKGSLPKEVIGSLILYPDVESNPGSKVALKSTINAKSTVLSVDYFGQVAILSGSFADNNIQIEAEWMKNMLFNLTILAPDLQAEDLDFSLNLETDLDGFKKIGLSIRHQITDKNQIDTKIQTHIENRKVFLSLKGILTSIEYQGMLIVDISQLPKFEGNVNVVQSRDVKSFVVSGALGDKLTSFKMENRRILRGFNVKINFTGCNGAPQVSLNLKHQKLEETATNLLLEWTPTNSNRRQLSLQVVADSSPWNYKFLFTSPFRNFEKLDGGISWKTNMTSTKLDVNLNLPFLTVMPVKLNADIYSENMNFKHEVTFSWPSRNTVQTLVAKTEGRIFDLTDIMLKSSIKIPQHIYELKLQRHKDKKHHTFQLDLLYDKERVAFGTNWHYERNKNNIKISSYISTEWPSQPKLDLHFDLDQNERIISLLTYTKQGQLTLAKVTGYLEFESWQLWDLTARLDSQVEGFPIGSIVSKSSMLKITEIHHFSEVSITPKFFNFINEDTKKIRVKFDINNEEDILGTLSLNSQDIGVIGKLTHVANAHQIDLEIASALFDPVSVIGEYQTEEHGAFVSLNAHLKDVNVLSVKSRAKHYGNKIFGDLDFSCSFKHRIEAKVEIDYQENSLEIVLKENEKYLINLIVSAQIQPTHGHMIIDIQSKLYPLLNKFNINFKYLVESGKIQLDGKYVNQDTEASITALGVSTEDNKKFYISIHGPKNIVGEIELSDLKKLSGHASIENIKMISFDIEHSVERGEFTFGKHVLTINVNTGTSYTIITSLGLDLDKAILTVNTPFNGWEELKVSSIFKLEPFDKSISIIASGGRHMYKVALESQTGQESGKFILKIETPIEGFKTADIKVNYSFGKYAENKIILTLEDKTISLNANWMRSKIELKIETPFELLESASLSGEYIDKPTQFVRLKCSHNDVKHQLEGSLKFLNGILESSVSVIGTNNYNLEISYDISKDYMGKAAVVIGGKRHELGGFIGMNNQNIHAGFYSPFYGFENISGKIEYDQTDIGEYTVGLEWNLNGKIDRADFQILVQPGKVQLNGITPFHPWNTLAVYVNYAMDQNKRVIVLKLERGDGKYFEILSETQRTGGNFTDLLKPMTALIRLEIRSNLTRIENFKLDGKYNRQRQTHEMSAYCNLFGESLEGKVKIQVEKTKALHIDIDAEASAPVLGIRQTSLVSFLHIDGSRESTLKAEMNFNGKQNIIESTFKITETQLQLSAQTSFHVLSHLLVSTEYKSDGRVDAVIQINEKRIEGKGQILWGGLSHTKVIFEVNSPFEGFKSTHLEGDSNFASNRGTASLVFQNDNIRYIFKADGLISTSAGHLTFQINSPIYKLEQVLTSLQYNTSGIRIKLDRNTKEEILGHVEINKNNLQLNIVSKIPGYQVDSKSSLNWGKSSPGGTISFSTRLLGQQLQLKTNIEGIRSVDVEIVTSIRNYERLMLQWNLEGDIKNGHGTASYNIPRMGQKSIRAAWKNDDNKHIKTEFWLNSTNYSTEKGFAIQYLLTPGKSGSGRFVGSLTYVLDKKTKEITMTTALKRTGTKSMVDFVFRTPFEPVREIAVTGTLLLNPEVAMDVVLSHNQVKLLSSSVNTFISPLSSKLKLNFNAPMISDPFNVNAAYDLATTEKTLEISFVQNEYQITVKTLAAVPDNSQEIELRMIVDSNVPSVTVSASGSLKASYKVEHDGNRQVALSIDSEQTGNWKIITSVRPSKNLNLKFGLDSPVPNVIPSIQAEAKWTGNLKEGVNSEFVLKMRNQEEIKATLTTGPQKFLATFKSSFIGLEDLSLEGKLDSTNGYKANVEISAAKERVSLAGEIILLSKSTSGSGSIMLNSSWQKIPSGSLDVHLSEKGDLEIKGIWGERNVGIRGSLKSSGHKSLLKSGDVDLTFIFDSQEQFRIQSSHYFDRPQFSLNITTADYSLQSYIHSDSKVSIISMSVQWEKEKIVRFFAETKPGHFSASIDTPWTAQLQTIGSYAMSSELHSAKGIVIYDGVQSILEANVITKSNSFKSRVNVDIPLMNQKFEATINMNQLNERNVEGNVELNMHDRHLAMRGAMITSEQNSPGHGKIEEKTLQLSILFPNTKYSNISTEFVIKKPVDGFASLKVDASVSLPTGTSKAIFEYDLPIYGSNKLKTEFTLSSPLLPTDPISGSISFEIHDIQNVNVTLKYRDDDFRISWNLASKFIMNLYVYMPTYHAELSPLSFTAEGDFDFPNKISLHVRASCDKQYLKSETTFIEVNDGFNSKIFIQAPMLFNEKQEFYLKLNKVGDTNYITEFSSRNGKSAVIAIGELVLQNQDFSLSGKVSGINGAHFIQIVGSRDGNTFLGEVNAESLSLLNGKKVIVSGRLEILSTGIEAAVECRTRKAVHGGSMKLLLSPKQGILSFKVNSPSVTPIKFDSEYNLEQNYFFGKIEVSLAGQSHFVEGKFDMRNLDAQILLNCPIISPEPFNIQLKCAIEEKDISLLGDLKLNGDHWRMEGTTKFAQTDDIEIKLELITPQKSLERITVGVKLDPYEIRFELHAPIGSLPSFVLSLKGIPLFEELNWKNMKPEIIIGLPWVTYTAAGALQVPDKKNPGEFRIMFEQIQLNKKEPKRFEVAAQVSPLGKFKMDMDEPVLLKFIATTPFVDLKTLEWELGVNLQWRNWAEIKLSGNFNDKQISFLTEIRTEAENQKFSAELITSIKNYERFGFLGQMQKFEEIGFGRSMQVEFYHPKWEKSIHFEIDYNFRIDGLTNMEGELSLKAPGIEIPPLVLQLTSTLKDSSYNGGIEGSWGEHRPSFKISASNTVNKLVASVELQSGLDEGYHGSVELGFKDLKREKFVTCDIQINHDQLLFFNVTFVNHPDIIEGELVIKTPFSSISSASTLFRLSPLTRHDSVDKIIKSLEINLEASLNDKKLVHIEVVNRNGRTSLAIQNPFQPISFVMSFDKQPMKLRVYGELCWNLLKPEESTRGVGFSLDRKLGGYDITFQLLAGEKGSIDLSISHLLNTDKLDHKMKMKWNRASKNQSTELGFALLLKENSESNKNLYDVIVRIEVPWRCLEYESHVEEGQNEFSRQLIVKWDALRNPYKRLGAQFTRKKISSWRSHSEKHSLTLIHAGLPHDLTFTLEKSYTNDEIQFTELTIQPNSFPQDQLTARISHVDIKGQGTQLMLILPSINLDINIIFRKHDTSTSVHISHMDIQGERHVLNVEAIHDHFVTSLDIQAGPEINLNRIFHLECHPEEDHHTLDIKIASFEFNANLEKRLPLLRTNLNFDYGRKLNLIVGLPHKKEIILKVSRNELGMNINEILMSLKLNASQTLSSRFHWRPDLFADVHGLSMSVPYSIKGYFTNNILKGLAQVNEEIEQRLELLDPGINRLIGTITEYTAEELDIFFKEVGHFVEYLGTLPLNNTYFDVNITHLIHISLETIQELRTKGIEILDNTSSSVFRSFSRVYNQVKHLFDKYYGRLEALIMPLWDQGENTLIQIWKQTRVRMAHINTKVEYIYETLTNIVEGNMQALEKQISGIELYLKLKQLCQDYSTWLEEIPIQDYTGQIRELFVQNIWHPLEHFSKPCFNVLNKILEDGNLFALLEIPPLPYVRYIASKTVGTISGVWRIVEAEQKIRDLFRHILHNLDNIMQRHIPTASMVWDLEKGQIEYHQPLNLFDWDDFTQLPQLKVSEDDELDGRQIVDFYFSISDTLRSAQPFMDLNWRDILPPFGAHAIMAGDHHYYTFDKKYYRFSGECSYVLVADLLHQNFTIVVNYENRGGEIKKKSYSIISGDQIIEIDTTLKVTLQGRKVELPLEVGPTFVRRQPTGMEIFDTRGFQMRCTLSPSLCIISVSGWYFGKLGGLLGTYDNENTNDLKTPDGQIITDVSSFAHSWRVGSRSDQCRMINFAKNETKKFDVDGICGEMLQNQNSPLRPCFGTIDPTQFMNMCKYDTHKNLNSAFRKESSCAAIGAYVLECQKNKIDLWMPPSCVRCKLEDGSAMTSGDNVTLSSNSLIKPPNSSDVVLLVEEAASLQEYNLNEIMSKLDVTLQAEGLTQNRYSIVKFGGEGPHRTPHIHTVAGQVWVHNTLRKFSHDTTMDGKGGGDLYEAIEYSATIGYRAGVSKLMIAVIADDEHCGDEKRFSDALTLLVENDFRLHILTPKDFTLKSAKKNEDGREIFGIDMDGSYNSRQSKRVKIEADNSMKHQIVKAKDFCTPLVVETNGTKFNLKHIHRSSAKKFIDVWSRRVAQSAHPSDCQNCDCVPDKNGGALILCTPCVSPQFKRFLDDFEKYDMLGSNEQNVPDDLLRHKQLN